MVWPLSWLGYQEIMFNFDFPFVLNKLFPPASCWNTRKTRKGNMTIWKTTCPFTVYCFSSCLATITRGFDTEGDLGGKKHSLKAWILFFFLRTVLCYRCNKLETKKLLNIRRSRYCQMPLTFITTWCICFKTAPNIKQSCQNI